jgi:arylsulfatase A-like enzyme
MVTATAAAAAQRTRPNIVFICSDDHHYQCLGAAGNPHIRTPNLDRLVSRGVLFSNGVISTPQCAPSRGILLSGQEIYQNGLESNGRTSFREGQGPTIVQQLNRAGYDTVLVGKWHIRPSPESCGFAKAPLWLRPAASRYVNPVLCRGLNGADQETPGHITELFTSAATEYIRGAKQPFLLWLTYNAPHTPWPAGGAHRKQYEDRSSQLAPPAHPRNAQEFDWVTYYSVITHLDEAIGRVIGAVEEAGLWDNTLIVFLGDNGYLCGTKGLSGKVYPWEESIRVPYCASGGMVRARGKVETPVASIDLPATFLDYAGVRPFYSLSGQSLRLELDTGKSRRQAAFVSWTDGRPEALMIMRAVEPYRVVRTAAHKYIVWESRKQALFDLRADPAEENDLSGHSTHAKLLRSMREHLMRRMRVTGDPARAWLG